MITLKIQRQCGCFKKSDLESEQTFNTTEEALQKAQEMCEYMNESFCQKHSFSFEQINKNIIIKMEQT